METVLTLLACNTWRDEYLLSGQRLGQAHLSIRSLKYNGAWHPFGDILIFAPVSPLIGLSGAEKMGLEARHFQTER